VASNGRLASLTESFKIGEKSESCSYERFIMMEASTTVTIVAIKYVKVISPSVIIPTSSVTAFIIIAFYTMCLPFPTSNRWEVYISVPRHGQRNSSV